MPLIKLRKSPRDHTYRDSRYAQEHYSEGAPFFCNPRGLLAHRVKSIFSLSFHSGAPWWIIDYWCENFGRTGPDDAGLEFDPGDRLVCVRCEAMAIASGEKTSTELAGRHVCTGVCRPVNVCCVNDKN